MIYAHMSNYRTATVLMVNTCQKRHNPAIPQKTLPTRDPPPCTSAPAVSSTKKYRVLSATATPARLPKNLVIPVAADPVRPRERLGTAAATGPVASETRSCFSDYATPSACRRPAGAVYGGIRAGGTMGHRAGDPFVLWSRGDRRAGPCRVPAADPSWIVLFLPVQGCPDREDPGHDPAVPDHPAVPGPAAAVTAGRPGVRSCDTVQESR